MIKITGTPAEFDLDIAGLAATLNCCITDMDIEIDLNPTDNEKGVVLLSTFKKITIILE